MSSAHRLRATVLAATLVVTLGCDPQGSDWGLHAIKTMQTPADDPALSCGVVLPADPSTSQRTSCGFKAGAKAEATLGIDPATAAKIPIRHVIVMMKENRSFDHLLGRLHDRGQPGVEAIPASYTNPDLKGAAVPPTRADTTCLATDPGHQSLSMQTTVNGGAMDGFVKNAAQTTGTDGRFAMSYYDEPELPFYYFLAKTWAVNDRHFAPLVSGTFANRNFMLFGHNAGAVDTGIVFPAPETPSLLQLLMNAKATWGAYTDSAPLSGSLNWDHTTPGVHPLKDLLEALDQGTLPNVVFVDGTDKVDDDHPPADLQKGEAWVKAIYDHALTSPQWQRLAIVFVYDEGGGLADHVKPDTGCAAFPGSPYTERGTRVPLMVISPWAKRGYVSHVSQDHTAITRFIATLFDLPALSGRDANSSALLELFDFTCGRDLSVPPAPSPGTGGCAAPP